MGNGPLILIAGRPLASGDAAEKGAGGRHDVLDYMSSIMRDENEGKRERLDAAKAAAPYDGNASRDTVEDKTSLIE